MKKNNLKLIIITLSIFVLSLIIYFAGQFLFSGEGHSSAVSSAAPSSAQIDKEAEASDKEPFPVKYSHISKTINKLKQEIFTLEFNPLDERLEFKPVLSFDNLFGFEKISEIMTRTGAYAAINGGFFFEYGDPVGMVAIDGELYMTANGYDPVLIVDKKGARFEKLVSHTSFTHKDKRVNINAFNRTGEKNSIVLYTSDYGSTNRAIMKNTSIRVEKNKVTAVLHGRTKVDLKKDTLLISFYGEQAALPGELGIEVGDTIDIDIKPDFDGIYQAYSCSSMLVSNGKSVAPDTDRWIGTLLNRDPRTAIGIKEDGNLLLIVVDGRQPGYSNGLTGKELAGLLIEMGVKEAAMLDGGATSQMFVEGKLMNRPSDRGLERPVAGAFIVKVQSLNKNKIYMYK